MSKKREGLLPSKFNRSKVWGEDKAGLDIYYS